MQARNYFLLLNINKEFIMFNKPIYKMKKQKTCFQTNN